jgi:hypothetical protein
MTTKIGFLFLLSAISVSALCQDRIKLIGLETGINFIESEMSDNGRIRASFSDYYGDSFYSGGTQSEMFRAYGGMKAELRSANNVFGFATGLRFNLVSSSLSKLSSPDYFYYLFRQTGTTTELLRIKKITQRTSYISVPLEVRVFFYRERFFRLYTLIGTEVGFKVASNSRVDFRDPAMEQYESEVSGGIEEAGAVFSTFHGRGGLIIGKENLFLDIGIMAPFVISGSATTLSDPAVGGGFHVQIQKKF